MYSSSHLHDVCGHDGRHHGDDDDVFPCDGGGAPSQHRLLGAEGAHNKLEEGHHKDSSWEVPGINIHLQVDFRTFY